MRIIVGASFVLVVSLVGSLEAQQQRYTPSSLERLRLALESSPQQPKLTVPTLLLWTQPPLKRFGFLTLVPPESNGEVVKVSIPVGELATRAAHAVSSAWHRRAERKADEKVLQALQDFQAQLPVR